MPSLFIAIAGLAASVCAGLMFASAGVAKLRHRALFPGVVANYRLLPVALVAPVALLLPPVELVVGAALLVGNRPLAPVLAIALLLVFAAAMAINLGRGRRQIDCGCGQSALRQPLGWHLVARNLVVAAALAVRLADAPGLAAPGIAVAAMTGVALFVLTMVFNALGALGAPAGRPAGGVQG